MISKVPIGSTASFYITLLMDVNHPAPYVYIYWRVVAHCQLPYPWMSLDNHGYSRFLGFRLMASSLKSVWKKFDKKRRAVTILLQFFGVLALIS